MRTNFQHLLIQEDNHVLKISMNRPEVYNAFNDTMLDELGEVLETAAQDAAVRCVVLTGTGQAFGSGHRPAEGMHPSKSASTCANIIELSAPFVPCQSQSSPRYRALPLAHPVILLLPVTCVSLPIMRVLSKPLRGLDSSPMREVAFSCRAWWA